MKSSSQLKRGAITLCVWLAASTMLFVVHAVLRQWVSSSVSLFVCSTPLAMAISFSGRDALATSGSEVVGCWVGVALFCVLGSAVVVDALWPNHLVRMVCVWLSGNLVAGVCVAMLHHSGRTPKSDDARGN